MERIAILGMTMALALMASAPCPARTVPHVASPAGTLDVDVRSDYSHIRVYRQGSFRTLVFVRDNGEEAVETMINLRTPHELLIPYSRYMFTSYLFVPKPKQVLIIGLGGGAMVHFLQRYDPEVQVDVVEIDSVVVKLAARHFNTRPTAKVHIETTDGLRYLETTKTRYDVVYMDAFLKPSQKTDATGVPRGMKTTEFYKNVQQKLQPEGAMVFNLNVYDALEKDLRTIRGAFAQVYVFRLDSGNVVAVCTRDETRVMPSALLDRGKELDRRFRTSFSFREMANQMDQ